MAFPAGFEHIVRENESLAPYTWLRIGGPARFFCEPTTVGELTSVLSACHTQAIPVKILGGGSNLLIRESGFDGLVLSLAAPAFARIETEDCVLRCGGGTKLAHAISYSVGSGLAGLEHLVGIPGTIGGALHSNSGTMNGDIGQHLRTATLVTETGETVERSGAQLQFSFHKSSLDELIILQTEFALEKQDVRLLTQRMQTLWIVKRAGQPTIQTTTAIPFVDPDSGTAADLIEKAGMKGANEGSVRLSSTFPNYIITNDGATSEQVLALLVRVRDAVQQRTGTTLQFHLTIW